ncbi:MAG: GNAT family N-acetyltransferase [Gammaproteobacteria bacterium]|nr:GNAT family N-acetyltransferase [Gammaproteobacteria bacterium]
MAKLFWSEAVVIGGFQVRDFNASDTPSLLELMRGLAEFEGYLADFKVCESDLIERGLSQATEFSARVAENTENELVGMAVFYTIPYTYDLSPDMVLKELFVRKSARNLGVGQALMKDVISTARSRGCKRIKWLVLQDNAVAKKFYAELGAQKDTKWENWGLAVNEQRTPSH